MKKLIKTSEDHAAAIQRLEELMLADPADGTAESEELELLAFLTEDYEKRNIEVPAATPIEAIRFRMDQSGLTQKELVPLIGSKSRVSEVLSGKRPLTLAMIRNLHEGLCIPLKSLVGSEDAELPPAIDTDRYPVKEMFLKGFFAAAFGTEWSKVRDRAEEMLQELFSGRVDDPAIAFNRQTTSKKAKVHTHVVHAWRCHVMDKAAELDLPDYDPSALSDDFVEDLTKLSRFETGPLLAQQALAEIGIGMIIVPHLERTHLDGAAIWHPNGFPIIALTLRHDRLDNFWFTLFHELGHVKKHLNSSHHGSFIDTDIDSASDDEIENEADRFALEAFIPEDEWGEVSGLKYVAEIRAEAKKRQIHPSIIAGRLRRDAGDYRKHRTLVGQGKVREMFDMP